MLNFDREEFLAGERAALALKPQFEEKIDTIFQTRTIENVVWLCVGGGHAHAMSMSYLFDQLSDFPFYYYITGEFLCSPFKKITKNTLVIVETDGETPESVAVIPKLKEIGCALFCLIHNPQAPLVKEVEYSVSLPVGVHYKVYYMILRILYQVGALPDYERICQAMQALPDAIMEVKEDWEQKSEFLAKKYCDEPILHVVGSGAMWGVAYTLGMCMLEEALWKHSRPVHATEFFHGALEVIDRTSAILLFKPEDASRPLAQRVEDFSKRITQKVVVMDTAGYALRGIPRDLRGFFGPFFGYTMYERLCVHLEKELGHPMEAKRYYRRFDQLSF